MYYEIKMIHIHNKTRIGVFAQGQILCISPNGLQTGHCDAPHTPPPLFWMAFLAISDQYSTLICLILFTKWLPVAILDDRKSLSITFLAISDQYATLIFVKKKKKWLPAAILDDRKSLSITFLAISDKYASFLSIFIQKGPQRPFCFSDWCRKS